MRASPFVPAGINHPRVRQYLNIRNNRGPRPAGGAIALEGAWAVERAVTAGVPVDVVFVCPSLLRGELASELIERLSDTGTTTFEVSERVLLRLVGRDGPDGLAAIAHLPPRRLRDLDVGGGGGTSRVVVADGLELAGNLGAIIRCADGAGASAVLLTDRRVRPNQQLVVKASMGTLFSMPVVDVSREDALSWLRRLGFRLVAAEPDSVVSYRNADFRGQVAIVVGSERTGLARLWRDAADVRVSIPMHGQADSLNVAHAAAILLYEALHQQSGGA